MIPEPIIFEISNEVLSPLKEKYPLKGKNSHIGKIAVEIAVLYFKSIYPYAEFSFNVNGVDLSLHCNDTVRLFEVKGTEDNNISFLKLKVSSQQCHDLLKNGTVSIMRITNIGESIMKIYFLHYGTHFVLKPEVRFSVNKIAALI